MTTAAKKYYDLASIDGRHQLHSNYLQMCWLCWRNATNVPVIKTGSTYGEAGVSSQQQHQDTEIMSPGRGQWQDSGMPL